MHIGIIGGIGPAATDFYYRGLINRHTKAGAALELTMVHADVHEMARNMMNGEPQRQAAIFARLIARLAAAGARIAAVTSMGGHFCIRELEAISPLPLLNAIPMVDAAIRQRNLRTIGIIGTKLVMQTALYGGITAARVVKPEGSEFDQVGDNYVAMASSGRVTEEQRRSFFTAGERLCREQDAEAVLLGGTDLPLAFEGRDPGFPVLDCADVHAEALYQASLRTV